MPTFVRTEKCDGCKGQDKTACMYICPHDLMLLDKDGSVTGHAMKAFNQEPEQCWECYSCVKICPQNAIEVRHYADVVPLGASVQPLRGSDSIMWTIKFRNGNDEALQVPDPHHRPKARSIRTAASPCRRWPTSPRPGAAHQGDALGLPAPRVRRGGNEERKK